MKNFFRFIFSRPFWLAVGLLAVIAFAGNHFIKVWRQNAAVDSDIAELRQRVAENEQKNDTLRQTIEYMQSDRFVEEEARTKLNYKKPGEEVVIVETRPGTARTATGGFFDLPPEPEAVPEPAIVLGVRRWLDYFFAVPAEPTIRL